MSELIFALDVGKASLGICVREGNTIHLLESLLIPPEFADTSDLKPRRRAFRTREAHKKRESWLIRKWQEVGLTVPDWRSPDFVREFPKRGDNQIYNSALLRIALLQEHPLAEWQIFKALWAAIQHRGYDPNCNWSNSTQEVDVLDEDTKQNLEALDHYEETLNYHIHSNEAYQFPCYLEASLMGLWHFEKPQELKPRISRKAERARGRVASRKYVIKELKALLQSAQKQCPALASLDIDEWLFGPGRIPYASLNKEFSKYRGTGWDSQGLLSQKVPRFDNRIIDKCRMLPKRNVCKASDPLNVEFVLLQKLKNIRFRLESSPKEALEGELTPKQLENVFWQVEKKIQDKLKLDTECSEQLGVLGCLAKTLRDKPTSLTKRPNITVPELRKIIEKVVNDKIVDHNLQKQGDELRLNLSGRASYCRQALRIMNEILLGGIDPPDFDLTPYAQPDKPNGITTDELESLRNRLGETWKRFHPGDRRMENLMTAREQSLPERERDILTLIGNVNNPVVRHRLTLIDNQLKSLVKRFREPEKVMLEFIRGSEGLEGQKSASDWEKAIKIGTVRNDRIREQLKEAGLMVNLKNMECFKLAEEQGWQCPYTGETITAARLEADCYDIDHIVPVSNLIATDAFYNKVLCVSSGNREKSGRTPHQWLSDTDRWDEYLDRLTRRATIQGGYSPRKKALLTSPKATELIESYNGLAETAHIARLTQAMIAIRFAWPLGNSAEQRRIFVNDGRITARIRRTYQLNEMLLWPSQKEALETTQDIVARREIWKKNRGNKKHHALDAYCISYAQQFRSETKKDGRVRWHAARQNLSPGLEESKGVFKQKLDALFPKTLRRNTKKLHPLETIYGYRNPKTENGSNRHYLTVRKDLVTLLEKDRKKIKTIFDPVLRDALTAASGRYPDPKDWRNYLKDFKHPVMKSQVKKVQVIESETDLAPVPDEKGRICFGEYKDFGNRDTKDGTKGITMGQFRHSTANKGQLLFWDGKRWKVQPVLSHEKLQPILHRLKQAGYQLYQAGTLFYPNCHIYVPNEFKAGKENLPAGDYNMLSMWSAGPVKISDSKGIEYLTSVNYLTAADFKRVT